MSERGPVLRMPLHLRKVPQLTFCFAANPVSLAVTLKIFQLWDQLQPFWSEGGQGFQVRLLLLESRTVLSLPALPTRLAFTCKHQVKFVFIQIISLCYRLTADPIFLTVELGVLWNESKPFRWQGCQGCQVRLFLLESGAILPVLAVKTGFAFTCKVAVLHLIQDLKGLRAESARAVTGRRCPPSGVGEDFLARRTGPLMKTGVTWKQKVAQ